jgi:hypothetical protein
LADSARIHKGSWRMVSLDFFDGIRVPKLRLRGYRYCRTWGVQRPDSRRVGLKCAVALASGSDLRTCPTATLSAHFRPISRCEPRRSKSPRNCIRKYTPSGDAPAPEFVGIVRRREILAASVEIHVGQQDSTFHRTRASRGARQFRARHSDQRLLPPASLPSYPFISISSAHL